MKRRNSRSVVLVTGAASGIGAATVKRFAAEGWSVVGNDLHADKLSAVLKRLPGEHHLECAGDFSNEAVTYGIEQAIRKRFGGLQALVSCAGFTGAVDPIKTPVGQWRRCLDGMTLGALHMSRVAARLMPKGGRIVHVTSVHSKRAGPGASSYAMAKAAVEQLCRALALELADQGILVNAIAPGFVDTPMSRASGRNELESARFQKEYVRGQRIPLRRAGRPEEIATVAWFLVGPDATYLTGQSLVVDGGLTITF